MPINYRYANITKFCRFGTFCCFRLNNLFQHANSTCQIERINEPKPPFSFLSWVNQKVAVKLKFRLSTFKLGYILSTFCHLSFILIIFRIALFPAASSMRFIYVQAGTSLTILILYKDVFSDDTSKSSFYYLSELRCTYEPLSSLQMSTNA